MAEDCFVDSQVTEFLLKMRRPLPDPLAQLEKQAHTSGLPVSSSETVDLIVFLCTLLRPKRILEIGTCVGFSALLMAHFCPDAQIDTIERNPVMLQNAAKNFANLSPGNIRQYEGDAATVLPHLTETYDLIFIDAAKGQYPLYFSFCRDLLSEGGVLISDNVLFRGQVASGKPDKHRNQTIVNRLTEYLSLLRDDPILTTTTLPISDGVTISVKREDPS